MIEGEPLRGTPIPGPDVCSHFVHGHDFYDGRCDCGDYCHGQRDRYDHWDWCPFWKGEQCDDCQPITGDEAKWYDYLIGWKRLGEAVSGELEFWRGWP